MIRTTIRNMSYDITIIAIQFFADFIEDGYRYMPNFFRD